MIPRAVDSRRSTSRVLFHPPGRFIRTRAHRGPAHPDTGPAGAPARGGSARCGHQGPGHRHEGINPEHDQKARTRASRSGCSQAG